MNSGLSNIKSAIASTYRSFDPQHTARYLAGYEWRFNRRFNHEKNVDRLALQQLNSLVREGMLKCSALA